jgi:hypothetical protein
MPKMALLAQYVEIDSVDMSDRIKTARVTVEVNQLDATTFGGDGWKEVVGGLKTGGLEIEWTDDFAASGGVDGFIWDRLGTNVPFEVRPDDAVVGVNNPSFTGELLVAGTQVGGTVGELAMKSTNFPTSGAIARATS